ncbi:hypothetical protein P3W24_04835 [Luteibacter sp. PPL201]|uniref:Uncharacterized protein n=1 Tax=Luteibacter sahnii TaxID=3021977 RepID=A0ABT6B8C0_9GAMM
MKRISFSVPLSEWHFYKERRRWVYDLTDPILTEQAWSDGRVAVWIDGRGYIEGHDQTVPLPPESWRRLPFRYFQIGSDIPLGNFEPERLDVSFGIHVRPSAVPPRWGAIGRCLRIAGRWWRHLAHPDMQVHDVMFLRLVALSPFDQPLRDEDHDFRVEVYEPGEPMPDGAE